MINGVAVGALLVVAVAATVPPNAVPYAIGGALIAGGVAGAIARERAWLAGVLALLVGLVLMGLVVLGLAWQRGDLAQASPNCDPCGLLAHLLRVGIVTVQGLVFFAVPAATGGWLGARVRERMEAPSPYPRTGSDG